ncbi:hypothetical protein D9758_008652 [Tetrapyrgos nigripes]|uniref:Uncharacterized protein n=1 Tax=Tetrapyrgos nigripes TaxID=182062 RepID=A0A8H5D5S6_9AGAR|nr:hypothetical protein D9758_008652 [Tetrapyrgos nigripes]
MTDKHSTFLPPHAPPVLLAPEPMAHSPEAWSPFHNHVNFKFAHHHFVHAQSSIPEVDFELDLWRAKVLATSMGAYGCGVFQTSPSRCHTSKKYHVVLWDIQGKQNKIAKDQHAHGSMFVPWIAGSDKMTVSIATGHQEYHPVYASPGDLTNTALLPIAFLAIPKTSKSQAKKPKYQAFVHQLYHASLAAVFELLCACTTGTKPDIVHCPDGHYQCVIYGLGPYITDYPEQVWLSCVVSGWCAKDMNFLDDLDAPNAQPWTERKMDYIINNFNPKIAWDDFRVCSDVIPFTRDFPQADIHKLMLLDLLHQVIKGTFKDHLVEWIMDYINLAHHPKCTLEILKDIDQRISAVPAYPGLQQFPDGCNFVQWTGNDSKALMKHNSHTPNSLELMSKTLEEYHYYCKIFIETGVHSSISLPKQHALVHYIPSICLFASLNGLCSLITESKHIKAVKEPWRQSNHYEALMQMLYFYIYKPCPDTWFPISTSSSLGLAPRYRYLSARPFVTHIAKLIAMYCHLTVRGMMVSSTFSYQVMMASGEEMEETVDSDEELNDDERIPTDEHGACLSWLELGNSKSRLDSESNNNSNIRDLHELKIMKK